MHTYELRWLDACRAGISKIDKSIFEIELWTAYVCICVCSGFIWYIIKKQICSLDFPLSWGPQMARWPTTFVHDFELCWGVQDTPRESFYRHCLFYKQRTQSVCYFLVFLLESRVSLVRGIVSSFHRGQSSCMILRPWLFSVFRDLDLLRVLVVRSIPSVRGKFCV